MNLLDDQKRINEIDKQGMYDKIIHMPEQVIAAYNNFNPHYPQNYSELDFSQIERIVICGMGGSAISGNIAQAAFGDLIPISVVKDYTIPYINQKTLVICISYSGNTEETLSCLQQAISQTPFVAAITSGGQVKELVDKKYVWMELEDGFPPRAAVAFLFFSLVKLLEKMELIPLQKKIVDDVVANLIKKAGSIAINVEAKKNLAKTAAEEINNKIPVIYSLNPRLAPLAYRWKCQFNENAKYPAFWNTFPEMNHNEIEGWEAKKLPAELMPIFLSGFKCKHCYSKRLQAFKKLLEQQDRDFLEFYVEGETVIEQVFSLIYLGDMISYYLAILQNVDPTSIDYIDYLKENI